MSKHDLWERSPHRTQREPYTREGNVFPSRKVFPLMHKQAHSYRGYYHHPARNIYVFLSSWLYVPVVIGQVISILTRVQFLPRLHGFLIGKRASFKHDYPTTRLVPRSPILISKSSSLLWKTSEFGYSCSVGHFTLLERQDSVFTSQLWLRSWDSRKLII